MTDAHGIFRNGYSPNFSELVFGFTHELDLATETLLP